MTGVLTCTYRPAAWGAWGTGDSGGRYTCLAHPLLSPTSGRCRQTLWPKKKSEGQRWRRKMKKRRKFKKEDENKRRSGWCWKGGQRGEKKEKLDFVLCVVSPRLYTLKSHCTNTHLQSSEMYILFTTLHSAALTPRRVLLNSCPNTGNAVHTYSYGQT